MSFYSTSSFLLVFFAMLAEEILGYAVVTPLGKEYVYTPGKYQTYNEAKIECSNQMMVLAMPTTQLERDDIKNNVDLFSRSWVGLEKNSNDNKWSWSDGRTLYVPNLDTFKNSNLNHGILDATKAKLKPADSNTRLVALCESRHARYEAQYLKCVNVNGGGWQLVRHTPRGKNFFSGNDNLRGYLSIGEISHGEEHLNYKSSKEWTKVWDTKYNRDEIEFLFASGDCNQWMVVHHKDLFDTAPYISKEIAIGANSVDANGFCRTATVDPSVKGSPRIGLHGMRFNTYARNGYLYMEDNYSHGTSTLVNTNGGVNVWIRVKKNYIANGACSKSPTTSQPTRAPTKFSPNFAKCQGVDGGEWQLVRHTPRGAKFFSGNDDLKGSLSIQNGNVKVNSGNAHSYYNSDFEWSLVWANSPNPSDEIEFLFADAKCDRWLVTHYRDIHNNYNGNYIKKNINIHSSSLVSTSHCKTATFNNLKHADSPRIGLNGMRYWTKVSSGYLYMENGYHWRTSTLVDSVGGINVWIRHRKNYQLKSCQ